MIIEINLFHNNTFILILYKELMAKGVMAYGEKMWLTTAISEKRDPKDVQKLFEECWGKTTSMGRIGEIRRKFS